MRENDLKIRDALVRLQHRIPRDKEVILKIGEKYYKCKEIG